MTDDTFRPGHVRVDHADLFTWLPTVRGRGPVVMVPPDPAEIGMDDDLDRYVLWLEDAVELCFETAAGRWPTVISVTDRMIAGRWHSKAFDVLRVALYHDVPLIWHKVALRRGAESVDLHRPTYTHVLAFGPGRPGHRTADVFMRGRTHWVNGVGGRVVHEVASWIKATTDAETIVNPACGTGALLWGAAALGLDGYGCDNDRTRVEMARRGIAREVLEVIA